MQSSNFDKINFGRKAVAKQTITPGELCVSFSTFFGKKFFIGKETEEQVALTQTKLLLQSLKYVIKPKSLDACLLEAKFQSLFFHFFILC